MPAAGSSSRAHLANGPAQSNGSNTAWYVSIWLRPARNFGILVATNQGGKEAETASDEAAVQLIRAVDFLA